jgi:uncharacterized membrane protein (DUF106 family)
MPKRSINLFLLFCFMKREDIKVISQLLGTLKDITSNLEKAQKDKDLERTRAIKKEMLNIQEEIQKLL